MTYDIDALLRRLTSPYDSEKRVPSDLPNGFKLTFAIESSDPEAGGTSSDTVSGDSV